MFELIFTTKKHKIFKAEKLGTSSQNISGKLRRDNLSENDLRQIANAWNATFEGIFTLNDTGKEI